MNTKIIKISFILSVTLFTLINSELANAEGKFTIYPSYLHGENKSWIIQDAAPEQVVKDFVTLENLSDKKETISLMIREARTQNDQFIPIDDTNFENLGHWTKLPQSSYTLAPNEKIKIPFTIKIPKGIPAKEYTGVIFAAKQEQNDAQKINLVTRIGVRMYINVTSPKLFQNNFFMSPSYKNTLFFLLSLFGLLSAIFYNLIHFLESKRHVKKHI